MSDHPVAIVVGASSGIGRATEERLIYEEWFTVQELGKAVVLAELLSEPGFR